MGAARGAGPGVFLSLTRKMCCSLGQGTMDMGKAEAVDSSALQAQEELQALAQGRAGGV